MLASGAATAASALVQEDAGMAVAETEIGTAEEIVNHVKVEYCPS